jgi:hypothetical protein
MKNAIAITVIILIILLLWRVMGWSSRESFAGSGVDIAAFLTALDEYNAIYESTCKGATGGVVSDKRCIAYEVPASRSLAQPYKPPRLPGAAAFNAAVAAWNGEGPFPVLTAADFGTKVPSVVGMSDKKEFIFYAAAPIYDGTKGNLRFSNDSAVNTVLTPWEQWINTQLRVWTTSVGAETQFGTYIEVAGYKYKFTKVFAKAPLLLKDALFVKDLKTNTQLGVSYTMTAATQNLRSIAGTDLENSMGVFELLLEAGMKSQDDVNRAVDAKVPVPVSVSSSAVVAVASSSAAPPARASTGAGGADGERLDLPELTYYEDAWFRNRALFAKMLNSVRGASAEAKSYAQTAGAGAEGQTYELTALKFLELDRLILKGATVNGVINVQALQGYNLEVPHSYDPAMYDIMNTMEEPSNAPIGLKCYDLSDVQKKIITYLSSRRYENLTTTNLQLLAKYRTNMCASYGYYSKDGVASCVCEGCCIPVDYKTSYGRRSGKAAKATIATNVAAMEAAAKQELGSGDEDTCVQFNRPYRLKRRELPLGVDEKDVCVKEGFNTRTFTEDVGAAKATAGLMKGWRMFQQRMVPAYLPGAGAEGFEDDCLTPSLPKPYRLIRGKPKLMTCG